MNTELLSKMVKELLLDNDTVNLPGLGSFVAEIVPATFSDSGHTINPPYRKLYFRDNIEREDDLLVKMYAVENNVTEEVATEVITEFIAEIKGLLNSRKSVVMPELGRLRATKENNYFFVPFENIDIYPEGEGLEPIPLKIKSAQFETPVEEPINEPVPEETETTKLDEPSEDTPEEPVEETPEEIPAETSEETPEEPAEEIPTEGQPEGESVVLNGVEVVRLGGTSESSETPDETVPAEKPDGPAPVGQTIAPPAPKSTISKGWLKAIIVIGSILLALALLILLFIILSHIFPVFFDRLLWS